MPLILALERHRRISVSSRLGLVYPVNSREVRATQRDTVSKPTNNNNKKELEHKCHIPSTQILFIKIQIFYIFFSDFIPH